MSSDDAYYLELQTAMLLCEANGDVEGAEHYQMMMDEFVENQE